MVVMMPVLAVKFFIALFSGTVMSRGQVRRTAGLRAYCAERDQELDILCFTNRAHDLRIGSPL